jgi:L-aspartate oxidase
LRAAAWDGLGVVRDAAGIAAAAAEIERLSAALERAGGAGGAALETRNLLLAGRLVAAAAQAREESRGAHFRADFPAEDAGWRRRLRWVLDEDGEPVEAGGARAPAAGPAAAVGGPGR